MPTSNIIEKIVKLIKERTLTESPASNPNDEFEIGGKDIRGGVEYTVTDIDKETGKVEWDVLYLPDFEELFDDVTSLTITSKGVYQKVKADPKFREIYEDSKDLRNKIRTHIRNEYPDDFKRITMKENQDESLDEDSTTGGGSASFTPGTGMTYATPYAFKKPKNTQEPIPESHTPTENKKLKVISKELKKASKMHKGQAKKIDKIVKEDLDLSSYGYSLVPKNKAGNYVQKGSKLDVKQLFEDQKKFQDERIMAFNVIEQEMNDIYKMLSNAKNETSEYYNDNPSSYTVVKPTDLVLDYIKDIKNLLLK